MKRSAVLIPLLLPLALACEARDPEEPAAEPTAEPAQAAAEPAEPAPSPAVPPSQVPSPPGPSLGNSPGGQVAPPESMKKLGEALGRAARAADEASAEGGSTCDRAYAGALAMANALHEQMGSANQEPDLPSRDEFVSACSELPEEVQRCMMVGYAIQNQAECRRVRQENQHLMTRVRESMARARPEQPGQGVTE